MTALAKRQVSAPTVPIMPASQVAPVVRSNIENKTVLATKEQMKAFTDQIRAGKPTGKIFPARLSEILFTVEQKEEIRLARKEHKIQCIADKKGLIKIIQARDVRTVGHRQNREGLRGNIKYVKEAAFADKEGKFDEAKFSKFVEGPKPRVATA